MPSNLCPSITAVSTAVRSRVTKTDVREAAGEEQLKQRIVQLSMRAQLHLPALDLSWALLKVQHHHPPLDLAWTRKGLSNSLWEPTYSTTLLLISPGPAKGCPTHYESPRTPPPSSWSRLDPQRIVQLSTRAHVLHHPPLDLAWTRKGLSNSLREPTPPPCSWSRQDSEPQTDINPPLPFLLLLLSLLLFCWSEMQILRRASYWLFWLGSVCYWLCCV